MELQAIPESEVAHIQDENWWELQRFKNLGENLVSQFEKSRKVYDSMRQLFKDH